MRIGVLALQGDFAKHQEMFDRLGVECVHVRQPGDLKACDGLVLPGGESTTFAKLMHEADLWEPLKFFANSRPIFGTCAGLIVLAREVVNQPVETLGLIDISVQRNAYGRQRESFIDQIEVALNGKTEAFEGVFIRAPKIVAVGPSVNVVGRRRSEDVLVTNGRILAATFHPELTSDTRIHEYFLRMVQRKES